MVARGTMIHFAQCRSHGEGMRCARRPRTSVVILPHESGASVTADIAVVLALLAPGRGRWQVFRPRALDEKDVADVNANG